MLRHHFETHPSLGVPNGWHWISHSCSPAAKDRTTHLMPVGPRAELHKYPRIKTPNLSAREGILSRPPFARGDQAGVARTASPRPRSPPLRPSCRRHLETEMLPGFSRAACPAAGTPAQILGQSQLVQWGRSSRAGGVQGAVVWGCAKHQERSGENEPQSLPSPASSIQEQGSWFFPWVFGGLVKWSSFMYGLH